MRSVMNISMPASMAQEVKTNVKKLGFVSISEFFRSLLRSWIEDQLLVGLKQSRQEIQAGKGKALKSLKDLR